MCLCMRKLVTQSCPTLLQPIDHRPPGSSVHVGFSRQEHWTGLPLPSPGDLPVLYHAGSSNPVLCDNFEGRDGMGGGREFQEEGDMCIPMADLRGCIAETNKTL